jgi:predicted PurR-regulated permease PerM
MGDHAEVQPSAAPPPAAAEGGGKDIPEWMGKLIWRSLWQAVAVVLITLLGLKFLSSAQDLVRWLILSALLSFALEPAVIYLHEKRGWRRGAATGLILFAAFLLIAGFGLFMVTSLARGASGIAKSIPAWIDSLNQWTQQHFHVTAISSESSSQSAEAAKNVNNYLQEHAGDILGTVGSAVGAVFSVFTVGMFTFYLTANGDKVRRALLSRMPPDRQARVLWTWEEAIKKTGGYLYSRGVLAAINGGLMFITLLIVGTPYAGVLAVFEGIVAEFIPIVGTYIAGAVPVVVTLATLGLGPALVVLAEILIYQQVENYFLSPKISAKTMELNAGVAFGAAMAGGAVGGFIGAFFGLPIAAVIQSYLSTYPKRYEVMDTPLTHQEEPPPPKPPKEHRWSRHKDAGHAEAQPSD